MNVLAVQRGRGGFGNRENRFQQSRRQGRGRGYGSNRNLRASDGRPICNYCIKVGHVERRFDEEFFFYVGKLGAASLTGGKAAEKEMNLPKVFESGNFGNSSVATSVLNDVEFTTENGNFGNSSVATSVLNDVEFTTENGNFGNSSVATSVLNDVDISTEKSCLAKCISDVIKTNVISYELNPKFCVAKIRGLVNENSVLMLVDTGSTVSIVNDCFVNRRDVSEVNNVCITLASGDKIDIIRKVNV
ncbi:unnamed protein product [Mytilus coruscus]|uniref:Uncharacterized protein n=1 Tax=Mytilus coruscus TaxID=42192 RepID=A0A6J8C4E1_MYTCO|nr:unnamed protein product [Mytilus coruscus]